MSTRGKTTVSLAICGVASLAIYGLSGDASASLKAFAALVVAMLVFSLLGYLKVFRGRSRALRILPAAIVVLQAITWSNYSVRLPLMENSYGYIGMGIERGNFWTVFIRQYSTPRPGIGFPMQYRPVELRTWANVLEIKFPDYEIFIDARMTSCQVALPAWTVALVLGFSWLWLYARARRRRRRPECEHCGYNLIANISGVCPECGTSIPEEQRRVIQINPLIQRTKS